VAEAEDHMDRTLDGVRVAILATDGFEQSELLEPRRALDEAGAETRVVSPKRGPIRGWKHSEWGDDLEVDIPLGDTEAAQFDALMLPGGVMNPDRLRLNPDAVAFVRGFVDEGKPIAAICHAPWTLIEAKAVRGRRITSWPSLMTDLNNAGAYWVDEPVVRDGDLVTSRKPDDIPVFNRAMVDLFHEAHERMRRAS
jgi:protease I